MLERPVVLQFELTSACDVARPGPMSDATWRHLVGAARWVGRVALAGAGEPFADPQCIDRLEELDGHDVAIAIATDGARVTPQIARRLADLDHLVEVNTNRRLRHGSLARAFGGLGWLGAALYEGRLVVSAVCFSDTAARRNDVLPSLAERRLSISTTRVAPASAHAIRVLEDIEHETIGRCVGDVVWDDTTTRQCVVPWEAPFVDKEGGVFPCCFAASAAERCVGRLGDGDDGALETIWDGVAFRRFRDDLVDGRTTPEVCRRCTTVPLGRHRYAPSDPLDGSANPIAAVGTSDPACTPTTRPGRDLLG